MTQFRLPDQVPVTWARINQSGEGGTKAMHMDGGGTDVYNYLMYTQMLPAPSNVSLQTRLRAKLISMTVGNASFEGAAVRHRGFKMTGAEPNLKLDTQVWDSNPGSGGRKHWISGNTSDFQDYSFIIPVPSDKGIDYVTWELVMRSPGQIIVSNVECRHYYGRLYEMDISGSQLWRANDDGLTLTQLLASSSLESDANVIRWIRYLKTIDIDCRKGQNLITSGTGAINGITRGSSNAGAYLPTTTGFSLKLRRKGTNTEDWLDVVTRYSEIAHVTRYDQSQQRIARYDYDRAQLVVFLQPHYTSSVGTVFGTFAAYEDPQLDVLVADFVAPSQ